MSDDAARRLTGEQVRALKFAAHRQLARAKVRPQRTRQQAQRTALVAAVRALEADPAFSADGVELRAADT